MKHIFRLALFITAVVYVLTCFLLPVEWDSYDGFIAHLVSGIATRNTVKETYLGLLYLTPVFTSLQMQFGSIPWLCIVVMFLFFLANSILVFIVLDTLRIKLKVLNLRLLLIAFIPLFFIIQFPSVSKPSLTGLSFILCGSAVLLVHHFAFKNLHYLIRIGVYLLAIFMYWCGSCVRYDSALAAAFLITVYVLLSSPKPIKSIIAGMPLLIVATISIGLALHKINEIPFVRDVEPQLFYLGDGVNENNLYEGLSERDSMKTLAVKNFYLNDEEELNMGFIKMLARKKIAAEKKTDITFLSRLSVAWLIAAPTIKANFQYLFLNLFLLLLVFATNSLNKFRLLVFQIMFWVIIFTVAYLAKLEDRHYIYMAQLFSYGNLLFCLQNAKEEWLTGKWPYLGIAFTTLLFFFLAYNLHAESSEVKNQLVNLDLAEKEIDSMAKGKILLLDRESKGIYYGTPFTIRKFSTPQKIVYYDMGHLALLPEYNQYLDNLCSCNSRRMVEFYQYLFQHRKEVLLISTDSRVAFTKSYLQIVHGKNLVVQKVAGTFAIQNIQSTNEPLYYYQIGE